MLKRIPQPQPILQVYAVIAVMLSAWTVTAFLWKLSAWLLVLNLGEILTVFSYAMVTNLVESLIVLLLLLIVCALLPPRILRDDFAARGTILVLGFIGSLMLYMRLFMKFGLDHAVGLLVVPFAALLLTAFLLGFSSKFRFVRIFHAVVLWISDRLVVFLYILVPLYVFLLAYVIYRNIA
ncbi:MAG TPA: hypothetical protein VK249_12375 [Anaerolineales bacterium]|nr:hypothetical protein [Anaerolineales bacterium]